jgi:hypothetical protein
MKLKFSRQIFTKPFNFLDRFSQNPQISNFVKIRSVGPKLFHADGQNVFIPNLFKVRENPFSMRLKMALVFDVINIKIVKDSYLK